MTRSLPALLAIAFLATGCAPKVYVRAMSAAAVNVPAEVQRVAVVDRSRPANDRQTVMGVLEGVVTGEQPFGDHQGRDHALKALVSVLEESPRFTVLYPALTPAQANSNLLDRPWTHRKVAKLCEVHGCDAVVALETFDTDTSLSTGLIEAAVEAVTTGKRPTTGTPTAGEQSDEPPPFTHWAERSTRLNATWRMYNAEADVIIDEVRDRNKSSRSRQESYSIEQAVAKLAQPGPMVHTDGRQLGVEYGRRIAPTWTGLQRKYYGGAYTPLGWFIRAGRPMNDAEIHVEVDDWEGATEIWRDVLDNAKTPRRRGKARYNLALAAEVDGRLRKAHKMAKKAAVELHSKRSRQYAQSLKWRIEEQERVEAQLAPPQEVE